jgi:DNA-binding ferritin-like protein
MEQLASIFFHSRTQTHQFHTLVSGPGSLAIHLALQNYYEQIIPLMDDLIEAYQGKYGIINYKQVNGNDNDSSKENIIAYFDKLIKFLETERQAEKLKDSWIQNELDNIAKLLYSTKYKLVNLG